MARNEVKKSVPDERESDDSPVEPVPDERHYEHQNTCNGNAFVAQLSAKQFIPFQRTDRHDHARNGRHITKLAQNDDAHDAQQRTKEGSHRSAHNVFLFLFGFALRCRLPLLNRGKTIRAKLCVSAAQIIGRNRKLLPAAGLAAISEPVSAQKLVNA